jgi:gamma-glutamyl hercynylcysteine S-oxide synthase
MPNPEILAQLSSLQGLLRDLLREETDDGVPVPRLGTLGWYLARSVYRELYWLREVVCGDVERSGRVRHIFADAQDPAARCALLPPVAHLLRWAQEIQDEDLRRLATPGALPAHPLLAQDRLPWYLLQEAAKDFERMLSVRLVRRLGRADQAGYRVSMPLSARPPTADPDLDLVAVTQGHYRIGSRQEPFAYDNELPAQGVQLASYRIARLPVTNAQYLGFMEAAGYRDPEPWDQAGLDWLGANPVQAPLHWHRDPDGRWYGVGLAGPADLPPEQPVSGINRHEALAYANWVARLGRDGTGAVLQHEYQWEVAARAGVIEGTGRVWECRPAARVPVGGGRPRRGHRGHGPGMGMVCQPAAPLPRLRALPGWDQPRPLWARRCQPPRGLPPHPALPAPGEPAPLVRPGGALRIWRDPAGLSAGLNPRIDGESSPRGSSQVLLSG